MLDALREIEAHAKRLDLERETVGPDEGSALEELPADVRHGFTQMHLEWFEWVTEPGDRVRHIVPWMWTYSLPNSIQCFTEFDAEEEMHRGFATWPRWPILGSIIDEIVWVSLDDEARLAVWEKDVIIEYPFPTASESMGGDASPNLPTLISRLLEVYEARRIVLGPRKLPLVAGTLGLGADVECQQNRYPWSYGDP